MPSSDRPAPSRDRPEQEGAPRDGGRAKTQADPIQPPQYFDPSEPWDTQSAEALTRLYEFGRRLPAPAARGQACAALAAAAGRSACRAAGRRPGKPRQRVAGGAPRRHRRTPAGLAGRHQSGQSGGPPQPPARCHRGALQRGAEPGGPALGPGRPQAHRSPRDGAGRARRTDPGPPRPHRCHRRADAGPRAPARGRRSSAARCAGEAAAGLCRGMAQGRRAHRQRPAQPGRRGQPRRRIHRDDGGPEAGTRPVALAARHSGPRRAHDRKRSALAGLRRRGPRSGAGRPWLAAGCGRLRAKGGAGCRGLADPIPSDGQPDGGPAGDESPRRPVARAVVPGPRHARQNAPGPASGRGKRARPGAAGALA